MAKKAQKVPITRRALIQRINRKLALKDEQLKTNRQRVLGEGRDDLGRYFTVDVNLNALIDLDVDLEKLGHELGVIAGYEAVEEEK